MLEVMKIDGKPVVLENDKDDNIIIKKDLLEKLLEQAYDNGRIAEANNNYNKNKYYDYSKYYHIDPYFNYPQYDSKWWTCNSTLYSTIYNDMEE